MFLINFLKIFILYALLASSVFASHTALTIMHFFKLRKCFIAHTAISPFQQRLSLFVVLNKNEDLLG